MKQPVSLLRVAETKKISVPRVNGPRLIRLCRLMCGEERGQARLPDLETPRRRDCFHVETFPTEITALV